MCVSLCVCVSSSVYKSLLILKIAFSSENVSNGLDFQG